MKRMIALIFALVALFPSLSSAAVNGIWKNFSADSNAPKSADAVYVESGGAVWTGTWGGKLCHFDGAAWTIPITGVEQTNDVEAIVRDRKGTLWAGGMRGLASFDGAAWASRDTTGGFPQMWVLDILEDRNGIIWFGSNGKGLVKYDGASCMTYNTKNSGLKNDKIYAVKEDLDGALWIAAGYAGTSSDIDGIARYDGSEWTWYEALATAPVNDIAIDSKGVKWFASANKGLSCYDGAWTIYNSSNSPLPSDRVQSLLIDTRGHLWIGTEVGGAAVLEGGAWTVFTAENSGIVSNGIRDIDEGPDGTIWFATTGGICRFTPDFASGVSNNQARPATFALLGNRPNPFNPVTTIDFTLSAPGDAVLAVYDVTGRKVRELMSGRMSAGTHAVMWDGRDDAGNRPASGVYLARLTCGGRTSTGKMLLMK